MGIRLVLLGKRKLSNGEIYLRMGNATKVAAVAVGDYYLNFSRDKYLLLKDSLYVPSIRRNLISVSSLVKDGYSFCLMIMLLST